MNARLQPNQVLHPHQQLVGTDADPGPTKHPSPTRFDFLAAADGCALTKRFAKNGSDVQVEPYPHVRDVTSHRELAHDIEELHALIVKHASQGHCLLKGCLDRALVNESRAGHTDPHAPTQWLLLDLDFDSGWNSVDDFLTELHPPWTDVSYIWQHSSSAGIKAEPGLRGHIWLMLETAIVPATIKIWLKERNLNVAGLRKHLALSASSMSLKWGLDISTCQNDKLIYIAPPILEGLDDPLTERITLVRKAQDLAPPPPCDRRPASIDSQVDAAVAELRARDGMPRRKPKYSTHHETQLLANPEQASVTGRKDARGFVYLNLNGGDSWAYYFPADNPDILYNFKDEPLVRLQAIAPEFYDEYRRAQCRERFNGVEPYVFRNPLTDQYMNMLYSKDEDRTLLLARCSSKHKLSDFMFQYGGRMPERIEDWTIEFDPSSVKVVDPANRWVNLFEPTQYIKHGARLTAYPEIPPTIDKVLTHVVAGCELSKETFVNWLACLIQTRKHLGTSWVFHGVQGTGKGLLLSKILIPLLGSKQVREWTTKDLDDNFNAPLEHTCLLWLDEFKASSARSPDGLMGKLKNLITESTLPVRAMHTEITERPNFVNVIIASNFPDPIALPENDRRFNVAPPQERALLITTDEILAIDGELLLFASFLMHYPACQDQARTILLNSARRDMMLASSTPAEAFFSAVRRGDMQYFFDARRANPLDAETFAYYGFERVLRDWARSLLEDPNKPVKCLRDDLYSVFLYMVSKKYEAGAFTKLVNTHRLKMKRIRIGNTTFAGLEINFKTYDLQELEQLAATKTHHLTLIHGGKQE